MKRFLLILGMLLYASLSCVAGPNSDELKSFKLLTAPHATMDGVSPAISPDGGDLYFYSYENDTARDLYRLWPGIIAENSTSIPQKVDCSLGMDGSSESIRSRDIDVSPDGKSVAFAGHDGSLYVLDMANGNKGAKPRQVTRTDTGNIRSPRWSPDCTKIAYLIDNTATTLTLVCVVDVASEKSTVLASDGFAPGFVWQQPWSPDSNRLVYAGVVHPNTDINLFSTSVNFSDSSKPADASTGKGDMFVAVMPIDLGPRTFIMTNASAVCPSWSLSSGRIAFSAPVNESVKIAGKRYMQYSTVGIWTCDPNGKDMKVLTHGAVPSKKQASEMEKAFTSAITSAFEKQYGDRLSSKELKSLRSRKMPTEEMLKIAISITRKETGIEITSFGSGAQADEGKSPEVREIEARAMAFFAEALIPIAQEKLPSLIQFDLSPVWSGDGKRIAFVRGMFADEGNGRLVLFNTKTGKERVLVDRAGIDCISWAKGDTELVVQLAQPILREGSGFGAKTQVGHPEIWLLEPK